MSALRTAATTVETARAEVADLAARLVDLGNQHLAVKALLIERDEALTAALAAEQLGEDSASAAKKARALRDESVDQIRGIEAALTTLSRRRDDAAERVAAVEAQFLESAADELQPRYQQLRSTVRVLTDDLAATLIELARVDAITSRIPLGTRSGFALMKSCGEPLQAAQDRYGVALSVSLPPDLRRLTEREILAALSNEAAAE